MSKLEKIRLMLQEALMAFARISTDKGIIQFDGDKIEAGCTVVGVDAEGNDTKLEDGEYKAEDGVVYVVKDGRVETVVEPFVEPKQASAEEPVNEELGCGEKKKKVLGDAEEAVPEPVEEKPAEEPAAPAEDEKDAKIKALEAEIAEKVAEIEENKAEIERLKAKVVELEKEPAAAPAAEEFEKAKVVEKVADKRMNNLIRVLNA